MSLGIISNYAANVALRTLQKSDNEATNSLAKLSAGMRVLSAKDDAASMAIGTRLKADVASLRMASVNAGQASSMLQIAEGGMSTISDMLTRAKVLSTQAGSGSVSDVERGMLQREFSSLQTEIDRVTSTTKFSDTVLLNGTKTTAPAGGATASSAVQLFAGGAQADVVGTTSVKASSGPTATISFGTSSQSFAAGDKISVQVSGQNAVEVVLTSAETSIKTIASALNADSKFGAVATATVNADGGLEISSKAGTADTNGYGKMVSASYTQRAAISGGAVSNPATSSKQSSVVDLGTVDFTSGKTVSLKVNGTAVTFTATASEDATFATAGNAAKINYLATKLNAALAASGETGKVVFSADTAAKTLTVTSAYLGQSFTLEDDTSTGITTPTITTTGGSNAGQEMDISFDATNGDIPTGGVVKKGDFVEVKLSNGEVLTAQATADGALGALKTLLDSKSGLNAIQTGDGLHLSVDTAQAGYENLSITSVSYYQAGTAATRTGERTNQSEVDFRQGEGRINLTSKQFAAADTLSFDAIDAKGTVTAKSYTLVSGDTNNLNTLVKNLNTSITGYTFARDGDAITVKSSDTTATANIANLKLGVAPANQVSSPRASIDLSSANLKEGDEISFQVKGGNVRTLTIDSTTGFSAQSISTYLATKTASGQVGDGIVAAATNDGRLNLTSASGAFADISYKSVDGQVISNAKPKGADGNGPAGPGVELSFRIGSGADEADQLKVNIASVTTAALGVSTEDVNISTLENANKALAAVGDAISKLQDARASVGAQQNRLDYAMQTIGTQVENMDAARSNLMDLDVAAEMSAFTSKSILQQAGVSMLAQANQMPRNLMRLFQ